MERVTGISAAPAKRNLTKVRISPCRFFLCFSLVAAVLSCAHTGPKVESEEEAREAARLEKLAEAHQDDIEKHPEKDLRYFDYSDRWMEQQQKRLERVVKTICKANHLDLPDVEVDPGEVFVLFGKNKRIINAWYNAISGTMTATAALMKMLSNDDELAVVIGHEMAHRERQHIAQRLARRIPAVILANIAEILQPGSGRSLDAMSQVLLSSFDRDEEREADVYGVIYAKKAGFDFRKAPLVWERFAIEHPEIIDTPFYWTDTHPIAAERLVRMRKIVRDLERGEDPITKYLPPPEEQKKQKESQKQRRERRHF